MREWQILLVKLRARAGRLAAVESVYRMVLSQRPRQRAALSALGRLLMRERRFDEAVEIWQRAIAIEPERLGLVFQLARALHREGRIDAAIIQYQVVLERDPRHDKAFVALGQLTDRLVNSKRDGTAVFEGVIALAQRLLTQESSTARSNGLSLLARIRSKSDPDMAVETWKQLAAMNSQSVDPLLQMARIRQRQRREGEALQLFHTVLERDPDHAEALAGYGHALAANDRAGAIRYFATWAERRPRDPAPRLQLARLYQQAQDWVRAEVVYRELLDQHPNNLDVLSRFAQLLSRDPSHIEQALDLWHRIADRDPAAPLPLVERAYALERVRRLPEAEAEYRSALQRAPENAMALAGLARLLSRQTRWNEAVVLYETLHRTNPSRIDALLGLGRCHEQLDRGDEALLAYQKALALDPADANALLYRGRLLRQVGRIEEAIQFWRQICAHNPRNTDAWHELIFMLASAERDSEALGALAVAEAALSASPASWIRLGLAAQAGQFHQKAVTYFEKAIAAEPLEPGHHARLGQHYFRQGIVDGAFHQLFASRELKPDDLAVTKQLVDTVHTLNVLGIDHMGLQSAPQHCGEILVPEQLFPLVRQIADTQIAPYEPVPGRIIVVTASLAAGGAERQLVNLLRGLSNPAFGLDLSLFCISLARRTRRDFFLPLLTETPVDVVTLDQRALETCQEQPETAPFVRLIRSFPAEMAGPIAFWLREFRRRRPQVVHAWQDSTNLTAAVAALLAGVPRITLGARSVRPDNPRRRLKRYMQEGYQAILGHPSVVLSTNSRAGAKDYAEWLGIEAATIEVIHNGIDFDELAQSANLLRASQLRNTLGVPPDAPVIGSAFRMSEEKRPLLWVEAAAEIVRQVPQAHFIVCGDGPMRAAMSDLATRLNLADRLHLLGSEDNIGSCYKAMDVVMLTSRHEGLPNVLLEAQSLGVPVVAPDVGGVSETIRPGVTGWAVPDADARSLAERVVYCLKETDWRVRAQTEAPLFVREQFGMAAMLRRSLEVYGLETPIEAT